MRAKCADPVLHKDDNCLMTNGQLCPIGYTFTLVFQTRSIVLVCQALPT